VYGAGWEGRGGVEWRQKRSKKEPASTAAAVQRHTDTGRWRWQGRGRDEASEQAVVLFTPPRTQAAGAAVQNRIYASLVLRARPLCDPRESPLYLLYLDLASQLLFVRWKFGAKSGCAFWVVVHTVDSASVLE
jgi:hypothetical protein